MKNAPKSSSSHLDDPMAWIGSQSEEFLTRGRPTLVSWSVFVSMNCTLGENAGRFDQEMVNFSGAIGETMRDFK